MPKFCQRMPVWTGLLILFLTAATLRAEDAPPADGSEEKRRELHQYMKGRYLFQKNCVDCHGTTGRGNGPFAAELEIKPRNFRTGLFKFRTTPYGMLPVKEDLRRTIRSGISGTAMPVFSHLPDEDIDALIVYLQNLSRNWNDPALTAAPLTIPEIPEWFTKKDKVTEHAAAGNVRFAQLCTICHGAEGKGDGQGAGSLMDAWSEPIRPANLTAPHLKSGDSPRDLYRTIATGMNGTPMIGYAGILSENEIWDVVAFVSSLGKVTKSPAD